MKQLVTDRGIKFLWHFTRLENVESILREGIVPRSQIEAAGRKINFNDGSRIDGHRDASCLSIGHPNYKMFYRVRKENPGVEWVVLGCDASVLWTKDCAFCVENAASSSVTSIPIGERKGKRAFEALFLPIEGKPARKALDIPDSCPTHPQSEVLVFDTIEPDLIVGVGCATKETADRLKATYSNAIHCPPLFSARKDYKHWK